MGVPSYLLASGTFDFNGDDQPTIVEKITELEPSFKSHYFCNNEFTKILKNCLTKNPSRRICVDNVLKAYGNLLGLFHVCIFPMSVFVLNNIRQ
jgi:hypothetical protein